MAEAITLGATVTIIAESTTKSGQKITLKREFIGDYGHRFYSIVLDGKVVKSVNGEDDKERDNLFKSFLSQIGLTNV